jgi:type IV secretion system protein VirB9
VRQSVLYILALLAPVGLRAELVPPRGVVDPRVRVVEYAADQVYRIAGYVGYAIHIELEEGEEYRGLGAGDSDALTIDVRGNDVFVKPRAVLVQTNLTLLTSRRRYHFDYSARAKAPDPAVDEVIYSLRFLYPPGQPSEANRVATALAVETARPRNLDYWYCGHASLRPIAAFDDGVHTHLRFSSRSEMPAIFVRNEDETESLLNFSVDPDSGEVVIHRVAPKLILRRGRVLGCIVNRSYAGSGERLPSGTVAPEVSRDIRGGSQ